MKWCLPALLISAASISGTQAQQTYVVKAGERINEALTFSQIYSYPQFTNGTVTFRDGKSANGKLNYNLVVAQIQFIDAKGDTLSLADEINIRHIVIAADTFHFNKVYVKTISNSADVILGERTYYKDYIQKTGAYGLSTATTATNSVDVLVEPRAVTLNPDQEITLVKHTDFYFLGKHSEIFVADKKNLPRAFPRHRKEINDYLSSNTVDFSKRGDLQKLCDYISQLRK